MALTKGSAVYNESFYKCRRGSTIYLTNETPSYNYYWFGGNWYPGGIPGTYSSYNYIVPSVVYKTSSSEPSHGIYIKIGLWRYHNEVKF